MADTGQGYKYQLSVTAYLASLLSKNESVKDYCIFYEVQEVEPFDDIVLAVQYNDSEDFRFYLVQVKSGKVTLEIKKYLDGYTKITKSQKWKFSGNISKINKSNIQYWYFACKTFSKSQEISFQEDAETKKLEIQERQCDQTDSIIDKNVYKLCLKGDNATTKNQDFFDNFYIYLGQPDTKKIANILRGIWKLNDPSLVIEYLDKYFTKNIKARLTKSDLEHELLRIRLSNYIVTPIKVIPIETEPAHAWIDLTLTHNITIIENALYTEVCLFGCILQKLGDIITVNEWNKSIDNEGKLNEEVKTKFSSVIFKPQTVKDLVIHFWISNKIPLILRAENELPALKEFSHLKQHYIIIDSKVKKRYDEMKRYNLSVIKDLGEVQSDKLLQSISVSMQGKKPTSLYEVINGDRTLIETFTCSDILKLIEPKQVYLKNECLNEGSDMLFIIGATNTEEFGDENYETIEDNIVMYCPPNQSDIRYQEAVQNPKFKNYKIYRLYSESSEDSEEKLSLINVNKLDESQFDEAENIVGNNSIERYRGLEYFFIDQHGSNVYRENENKAVPIIGEMINVSCPRYLNRRMCKGFIKHGKNKFPLDNNVNPVIEYTESPFCEKDLFNKTDRKICVITGEPGIGKTTFLRSLVQMCYPQQYILFCDLALYKTDMYDKSRRKSELCKDPLNFLCNKHNYLPYSKFLSLLKKDPSRLIIILDSLDEVVATCEANVLKLIEKLNREPCLGKLIIGSRLLTVNFLTKQFDVDLVEIEGFSVECNGSYIENWNFDENYIRNIPDEFLRNPLYLNFLKIIAASDVNMKSLNRWTLYKTIIDLKIDLYYERRNENPDDTDKYNILKDCHGLALEAFLPYNRVAIKFAENRKKKYTNFARIGLIKCFDKNGLPIFVHHTFLEFFISQWLIEAANKEDAKFIYQYILNNPLHHILYIYSEQFILHKAIINKNLTQVKELCDENPELLKQTDGLGRTALHIAAIYGLIYDENAELTNKIIQKTLETKFNLYPRDDILNWTWIDYCHSYLDFETNEIHFLATVIQEAYWNYHVCQVKNGSTGIFLSDDKFFKFYRKAFEIPSINLVKSLFFLKHYINNDLVEAERICLRSEITASAMPRSFIAELGTTLMHLGCIYTNINIVSACISRGDDVNARDKFGCTPLYYGVCSQKSEIVELLLQKGADMKLHPTEGDFVTLFGMSLRMQNKNIMTMLINSAEKSFQDWECSTPLHDALNYDDIQVIEMLLKSGANVNIPNKDGDTLLHLAVRDRRDDLVELLLRYNPNLNIMNSKGDTPLFEAIWTRDMPLIEKLLNLGADVNIVDIYGNTLLCIAVNCSKDLVQLFLQYGADVNRTNGVGETPLFSTLKIKDAQVMELFLNAGANVNVQDVNGNTALHIAVDRSYCESVFPRILSREAKDDTEMIGMLLNADANVNIVNKLGATPLHMAVSDGFEDAVRLLVQYQANICATNYRQETPLYLAVVKENIAIINILLNAQVNLNTTEDGVACINMESQNSDTSLCCAIRKENVEIVNTLLEKGADVNYVDKNGRHLTPLFTAVKTQNLQIIEILLHKGANINFKSEYDMTSLYFAVLTENLNVLKLLLDNKASQNIVTSMNTLLSRAKKMGNIHGALELLDYWAKRSGNLLKNVTLSNEIKHFIQTVEKETAISLIDEINLNREENNAKLVHALLKDAALIKKPKPLRIKCLDAVLELNNYEVDQILLRNFNKNYKALISYYTDVGYAAMEGNTTIVKILLRNRKNVNNIFLTRVIRSSQQKHPVEILLENQIDVNLADEYGETPLLAAIDCSTLDIVKILLEHGADVNGVNNQHPDRTPLRIAIEKSRTKIVCALLQKGANMNVGDKPLLHIASQNPNTKIVRILLEHGADPNQTDKYGQSALHRAVEMNRKHIVKKLLEFKADVNITDRNGLIPLTYAIAGNMRAIIRMLRKEEGDENDYNESDSNSSDYNDDDDEML